MEAVQEVLEPSEDLYVLNMLKAKIQIKFLLFETRELLLMTDLFTLLII